MTEEIPQWPGRIAEAPFRADIEVATTSVLIMRSLLGTLRLRALGVELNGTPIDGTHIYGSACVVSRIRLTWTFHRISRAFPVSRT